MVDNIAHVFAAAVGHDSARPLLTWYDDATADRTELSGATLDNWVAKTANLLVDSAGLAPGDEVGLLLPPHWQTAAVLLGCWVAHAQVSVSVPVAAGPAAVPVASGSPAAPPAPSGPAASVPAAQPHPVDVLFAAADQTGQAAAWPAGERYALALAPLAAPLRQVPAGYADYITEVRGHGDHFAPHPRGGPQDEELCWRAARRAAELGIGTGSRALIDAARHPDPVDWLLAPLVVGASIVLCGNLDRDRLTDRAATERVDICLA